MPPVLLAELGSDPQKATVCFYGHLDVQPARQEDGWLADPYALTEVDGRCRARTGRAPPWTRVVRRVRGHELCAPPLVLLATGNEQGCPPGLQAGPVRLVSSLFLSFVKESEPSCLG